MCVVALTLLTAACSAKPSDRSAAQRSLGSASASPKTNASASASPRAASPPKPTTVQKENSRPNVPAPPVAARTPICPNQYNIPDVDHSRSWIIAYVDYDRGWGDNCATMSPGQECWIPFSGGWQITETDGGSMVFQVFENDASTPVRSPELGPVPSGGQFSKSTRFQYTPSPAARRATFRVLLKDALGRVVATSSPQTVPIPASQC
jgi:hypothetical protein